MKTIIREVCETDIDTIVEFGVNAWEPVFHSFKEILGESIFEFQRPNWREEQGNEVAATCRDKCKYTTFVADVDGKAVGFVCVTLNRENKIGEIDLLAVDPNFQNQNIGTELNLHALDFMKKNGMVFAEVGTGGDRGHAPARRAYEKAGFTGLPLVHYYKMLDQS